MTKRFKEDFVKFWVGHLFVIRSWKLTRVERMRRREDAAYRKQIMWMVIRVYLSWKKRTLDHGLTFEARM